MKTLTIQIHTRDWRSIGDSLKKAGLSQGNEIQISDEVSLRFDEVIGFKELEIPGIYKLTLLFFSSASLAIAGNLAANLLYDILKGNEDTTQLVIQNTRVEIEQGEIKRIIVEKLEIR